MPNFLEKYPLVIVAGAIGAGLLYKRYRATAAANAVQSKEQQLATDSNPWNMATTSALDAYQYYTTSTSQTRLVYGVGQEVNLVSTNMLDNALKNQHDEIMQEVGLQITALQGSWENYLYNPYDTAIAGAANGAQMSYPTDPSNTIGGHD